MLLVLAFGAAGLTTVCIVRTDHRWHCAYLSHLPAFDPDQETAHTHGFSACSRYRQDPQLCILQDGSGICLQTIGHAITHKHMSAGTELRHAYSSHEHMSVLLSLVTAVQHLYIWCHDTM